MAKKKYNIENPDSYYRAPGKDISLQDFNTAYIEYLDKREELRKQKLNLQNIVYYYEDDQVDPEMVFMWVNLDLKEYFLFLDDADTENVKNGIDALMSQYSYTCSYVLVETDIPVADLVTTMTTFALDYGVTNGCIDVTNKYVIDPENPVWIINFLDDIFTRYYNINDKIIKPIIPLGYEKQFQDIIKEQTDPVTSQIRNKYLEDELTKILTILENETVAFPGDWPQMPQFHATFYAGQCFAIPDYLVPLDVSQRNADVLVCVTQFFPAIKDVFILPRRIFAMFHQWVWYYYQENVDSDDNFIDNVINELKTEIWKYEVLIGHQHWRYDGNTMKFNRYNDWNEPFKRSIDVFHLDKINLRRMQTYVKTLSAVEGNIKFTQFLINRMNQLIEQVASAASYKLTWAGMFQNKDYLKTLFQIAGTNRAAAFNMRQLLHEMETTWFLK